MVRRRTEDLATANQTFDYDPDALSQLSAQEILEAVQHLTPVFRAVFNLYVVEGYTHKEIGEALQITESTSRSNLVKARAKLQAYFTDREVGLGLAD
jgi:RNA polymerase sigma-70 factor (ECF subfamily)